jgi:hypothetical protein
LCSAASGLSASDLSRVPTEKTAQGDTRLVTLTAHGEFSLHGHKVNKDAVLELHFHYPAGAAPDSKPDSLDVTSKIPLHVALADHDVRPGGPIGRLVQDRTEIRAKVAPTADVALDLHATLTSAR